MNLLKEELLRRKLPSLTTREEMVEIMQREVYGYLPKVDFTLSASEPKPMESRFDNGNVQYSYVTLTVNINGKDFSFRVDRLLHLDGKKRPLIIFNNFHPMASSHYFPIEEMSEYDVDYLLLCYTDVTSDDEDFENGIAPLLLPEGRGGDTACGKIIMWAWAAMRVLDYGLTLPGTDPENVGIAGHSRLGKTAAVTAMLDERFKFTFSNCAGCSGDALAHGNTGHGRAHPNDSTKGELIDDIMRAKPCWFCKNYGKYTERNIADEFDQHFLLASIAPRFVMVGSCDGDPWADPISQQLCALAASEAWERLSLPGILECEEYFEPGSFTDEGRVGFFKLHSKHFLSRHCWKRFLSFVEKHRNEKV